MPDKIINRIYSQWRTVEHFLFLSFHNASIEYCTLKRTTSIVYITKVSQHETLLVSFLIENIYNVAFAKFDVNLFITYNAMFTKSDPSLMIHMFCLFSVFANQQGHWE